nr:MerR family transcriptional regulator [Gracilibacillus ureilyticus]
MGELAKKTKLSKRTIDYYTKIGLLDCVRSASNYRLYPEEVIEDLKFIEKCKQMHLPLEQIKQKIELMKANKLDIDNISKQTEQITSQMNVLRDELVEIYDWMEKIDQDEKAEMKKRLHSHSIDLIKTLVLFSS